MKIEAMCRHCGRGFLLVQLLEGTEFSGRCPWCGELLAPDYTELLRRVILRAERSGSELVSSLRELRALSHGWDLFLVLSDSVFAPLYAELEPRLEVEKRGLREGLRAAADWVERQSPEIVTEGWSVEADAGIGRLERELFEAGSEAEIWSRRAHEEEGARAPESVGHAEVPRRPWLRAVDDLTEARKAIEAAGVSPERVRAALEHLHVVLREAEEAAIELGQ